MSAQKHRFRIDWQKGGEHESQLILNDIAPHVDEQGYSDLRVEIAWERLAMRFKWDEGIPESYKIPIVRTAMHATWKEGSTTTAKAFHEEVKRATAELVERKPEQLIATTWITVYSGSAIPRRRQVEGATITFARKLSPKYEIPEIWNSYEGYSRFINPPDCLAVRVKTIAYSKYTASPEVYEKIDFLRGLWNLWLNRFFERQTMSGDPSAFNRIRNPYALLIHRPDGSLAFDHFWKGATYPHREPLYRDRQQWLNATSFEIGARRKLRSSPIGTEIAQLIRMYAYAMDVSDFDISISRLWMILEKIAIGRSKASHQVIPLRISSLFVDSEQAVLELDDFRRIRNSYVHDLASPEMRELLVGRLNFFVAQLLHYLIQYGHAFSSLSEFSEFLDWQHQTNKLREKVSEWTGADLPRINSIDAIRSSEPAFVP